MDISDVKIAVVGLGYVGLPLAAEFGRKFPTIGFDINQARIGELRSRLDSTLELSAEDILESKLLTFTGERDALEDCNVYIVTVPTPIDRHQNPNLTPLKKASELISKVISKGDYVIFESTVYPGATEEECVPIIEEMSGFTLNLDFFVGYSPERINPGDKSHRLVDILKVTSGSNELAADFVDSLYNQIITAGTYKAPSIKTAEAAKVIENTQRDLNIALINELSIIFDRLEIDTEEVLKAAETKWNFLSFRPGLVGGHCIGVDPYYLTHKAQSIGYHPEIILAGRKLNDSMGKYVAEKLIKSMIKERINVSLSKVLILGLTFKENCPDLRNSKVVDIISELMDFGISVDCYDPWVSSEVSTSVCGISQVDALKEDEYDAIILAVSHNQFLEMGASEIRKLGKENHLLFDLKYIFQSSETDLRF